MQRGKAREDIVPVTRAGNVPTMPSAGKNATGIKRWKTRNRCQAQENMQPVPNAAGQTCNKCKTQESRCNGYQARENLQPVKNAGKQSLRKEVTFDLGFFHKFRVKIASINFQSSKNCFNTETANYQST